MGKGKQKLDRPETSPPHPDQEGYARFFPYYVEFSALSEFRKHPGCGIELSSGIGGHSVLYLNGVKVDRTGSGYPLLRVCSEQESPARHGAGISVNEHYRNANWVAVEGRDFFMRGALSEGEPLTRDSYYRTQEYAKNLGILDGIEFHPSFLRDKPQGMSEQEYMYELSIATDYGIRFGRDAYCTRVPLDVAQMQAVVHYLNELNHPYQHEQKSYRWKLFTDNCVHVGHNALAQAGIWADWPTGQWAVRAAFKFPVPKNTLVDLILRSNDLAVDEPVTLYADAVARSTLLRWGTLPTGPGALTMVESAVGKNDIYDVARKLKLIFYDNPFWGPYRYQLHRIFSHSRYTSLRDNLRYFAALYAPLPSTMGHTDRDFWDQYQAHILRNKLKIKDILQHLEATP